MLYVVLGKAQQYTLASLVTALAQRFDGLGVEGLRASTQEKVWDRMPKKETVAYAAKHNYSFMKEGWCVPRDFAPGVWHGLPEV